MHIYGCQFLYQIYISLHLRQVYLDKTKLDVDSLIGQPYGSTFEVDRGKLSKVERPAVMELSVGETCKALL